MSSPAIRVVSQGDLARANARTEELLSMKRRPWGLTAHQDSELQALFRSAGGFLIMDGLERKLVDQLDELPMLLLAAMDAVRSVPNQRNALPAFYATTFAEFQALMDRYGLRINGGIELSFDPSAALQPQGQAPTD
jgi:hypothetical protein